MLAKFSICDPRETSVFIKQIYVRVRRPHKFPESFMIMMMVMIMVLVVLMVVCLV
jgi:hypothetical protein